MDLGFHHCHLAWHEPWRTGRQLVPTSATEASFDWRSTCAAWPVHSQTKTSRREARHVQQAHEGQRACRSMGARRPRPPPSPRRAAVGGTLLGAEGGEAMWGGRSRRPPGSRDSLPTRQACWPGWGLHVMYRRIVARGIMTFAISPGLWHCVKASRTHELLGRTAGSPSPEEGCITDQLGVDAGCSPRRPRSRHWRVTITPSRLTVGHNGFTAQPKLSVVRSCVLRRIIVAGRGAGMQREAAVHRHVRPGSAGRRSSTTRAAARLALSSARRRYLADGEEAPEHAIDLVLLRDVADDGLRDQASLALVDGLRIASAGDARACR